MGDNTSNSPARKISFEQFYGLLSFSRCAGCRNVLSCFWVLPVVCTIVSTRAGKQECFIIKTLNFQASSLVLGNSPWYPPDSCQPNWFHLLRHCWLPPLHLAVWRLLTVLFRIPASGNFWKPFPCLSAPSDTTTETGKSKNESEGTPNRQRKVRLGPLTYLGSEQKH